MIDITVKSDDIDKFIVKVDKKTNSINSQIGDCIKRSTMRISKEAKNNLRNNGSVVTGNLRRGIATNISNVEGTVHTSNIKYAPYVEEGTKPHIIRPRRAKYLYWAGAKHPVKQVNHPGTQAKPYLKPAFEKEKPNFIKDLQKVVKLD